MDTNVYCITETHMSVTECNRLIPVLCFYFCYSNLFSCPHLLINSIWKISYVKYGMQCNEDDMKMETDIWLMCEIYKLHPMLVS